MHFSYCKMHMILSLIIKARISLCFVFPLKASFSVLIYGCFIIAFAKRVPDVASIWSTMSSKLQIY
jgi:hypothetical protein